MLYFSASKLGFYDTDFAAYALPLDAVEISRETWDAMMTGQGSGKRVSADANGNPVLQEIEIDIAGQLKRQALKLLDASDIQVIRCVESGIALPDEWKAYRATLRGIASSGEGAIPNRPNWL